MRQTYSFTCLSERNTTNADNLRRQLALTQAYCHRHGLRPAEELTLQTFGVSAFERTHAVDKALSMFLAAVEDGRVLRGSVLITESLDRLSRENPLDVLKVLLRLLEAGIEIVTLQPERRLTADSLNDIGGLLEVIGRSSRQSEGDA